MLGVLVCRWVGVRVFEWSGCVCGDVMCGDVVRGQAPAEDSNRLQGNM